MALLGGILLNVVYSDKPSDQTNVTQHALESGDSVADHIERKPTTLSINGVVTGSDAAARLAKLLDVQRNGQILTYTNRVRYENLVITKFDRDHGKQIGNGFIFAMTLTRIIVASTSPVKGMKLPQRVQTKTVTNKGRQQTGKGQPTPIERKAEFLRSKGLADRI